MSDDQRFYMTYARSRPNEIAPWAEEHDVPLLTNAIHRWSENTERFLSMWEYDTCHVIDAGGYNVMASYVTQGGNLCSDVDERDVAEQLEMSEPFYSYSLGEYHDWLCEHSEEFSWATVMDFACEERFDELWSYQDRMDATLDTTIRQFNQLEDDGRPYKLLPVLQGRDIEEYVWFYDQLDAHGIPTDHVGIGTVCRMSSEKRIVNFEEEIRERTDVDRLHGFGVKIEAFKHGAGFDSADSQAWVYSPSNGQVVFDDETSLRAVDCDDAKYRTVESFKNYYSYVSRLQQGESGVEHDVGVSMDVSDEQLQRFIENTA